MAGEGRVLIRPSGTEPLVRVMLEGKDEGQLRELATNLANLIQSKLS
jgi:phosphoglucosamine mutase